MKKYISVILLSICTIIAVSAQIPPNPPPRDCPSLVNNQHIFGFSDECLCYDIQTLGNETGAIFNISAAYDMVHVVPAGSNLPKMCYATDDPDITNALRLVSGYMSGSAKYNVTMTKTGCTTTSTVIIVGIEP